MQTFQPAIQLAPTALNQPLLPNWSFNLLKIDLGSSTNPWVEQQALQRVGSYGKQIGHLAEALEVLVRRLDLLEDARLTPADRDTLSVFLGDVAAVRRLK